MLLLGSILAISFNFGVSHKATSAPDFHNVGPGSFIIDMGIIPQTYNNGLKPYGLVYDLVVNHQVPVLWVINPLKLKDGTDFTHNGVSYKGGPFIIESTYIDSTVSAVISSWQALGVSGNYTVTTQSVPMSEIITSFPRVMIDTLSSLQNILIAYFNNALIPSSAYDLGAPSGLTTCHDVWANPHGDPVWSTHSYLYDFVTIQKSWIWAQCHAVSMLENCRGGTSSTKQLNFLTTNGLKCWGKNKCGSASEFHSKSPVSPYTYSYPTDPYMQFMGNMHNACFGGSEQWFQPLSTGSWRPTTQRGVRTGSGTSPGEGTVLVYGPAFGDATNGWVMYEGGHSLDSGGSFLSDRIAGQRAFLNFLLQTGISRKLQITASMSNLLASGQPTTATATVIQGSPPYTYEWSSSLGATFGSPSSATTQYIAPLVTQYTYDIITIKITDTCGRVNFRKLIVYIGPPTTVPISLLSFSGESKKNHVHLKWETASESNNDHFSISSSADGIKFNKIGQVKAKGNSTELNKYSFIDNNPYENLTYYSLSQTDFDGKSETFTPIVVKIRKRNEIELFAYPNPFDNKLNVLIQSASNMNATLELINTEGIRKYEAQHAISKGGNSIIIDSEQIESGIYLLRMINKNDELSSIKVFKQ